jgi:aldehyde:ferredoxin oxidoreductase
MLKKVLFVNLKKRSYEVKTLTELQPYVGGLGIGLKLLQEYYNEDPLIFSIGPLNGFFPFASKTSIIFQKDGVVEDLYIGGTLSSRLKFTGLDSIVILGESRTSNFRFNR